MSTPLSREGKRSVHKPTATRDKPTATAPLRMSLRRKEIPEEKERGPLRMSKLTTICPTRSTVSRLSAVPLMNNRRPPSSIGSATVSTTPVVRPATGSRLTTRRSTVKKSPRVTQSLRGQSSVHDDSPEPAAPISSVVAVNTMPLVTFSPSVDTGPRSLGTKTQSKADVGQYNVPFTIKGPYVRVAVVRASASIWAANGETGTIDVYSSVSGLLSTRLPARTTASGEIIKPTALKETPTHLWVGYDDGSVVVHDHLCLVPLTMGCFHKAPVIAFCVLSNGITVSGSSDMAFVRWDTEEKNFEAISRIFGVSELHQGLTCMAAFGANIVLCGSMSGAIVAVDCASGLQIATLRGHANRVNALTLMGNLIFSASEDGYVNVWNVKVDETFPEVMLQKSFYLLKCIPLQVAVRDLVIHEGSRSLWVAYADGLVERWSANPDDDFGVEQVVRGAFVDVDESQEHQKQRQEVISLDCIRNVDTMRVLALGSNGISKVWCSLRNTVEESLQQAINDMNAIITQDTTEAAAWEQKALILREKEVQRKEKYGGLLTRLHARRLLIAYYTKWRARINFHRLRGRQQEEICLTLEERHQFRLVRRYFSIWCEFYDREQRRFRRQLTAAALERLSHQTWVVRLLFRWRGVVSRRKAMRRQGEIAKAFARVSNGLILGKFFTCWKCYDAMRRGVLPEEKLALLVGKSRQRVLRQAYEDWKMSYASRGQIAVGASVAPAATGAVTKSSNRAACAAGFAEAYAKVTIERGRRRVFSAWRRWHEYRCGIVALRALAIVREKQCQRNILYRALLFWQLFCRKRRFEKLSQDVEEVEKRLRHAEETHVDIFDKLQLQKRLEQLRRQQEEDQRLLHEDITRAEELNADREVLRRLLDRSSCIDDDATARTSSALFSPAVLKQLPIGEAMAFVMARMKGMVLNIYTDIQLFRQIKDRLRCGTTAAVIFLEGFQEVKRLVVTFSKKQSVNVWRSGERWPLTTEILENLPLHPCATVVQGIKTMVVAYDMVGAADIETVSGTRAEIVTNADLLFMLWRACYTARKPPLPVNNRVSSRF